MAFSVAVTNRQRRVALDAGWISSACARLSQAICENLKSDRPDHLSPATIEHLAARGGVSLALVSNRRIESLNRQWRHKGVPTDVLSFPLALEAPPAGLPWEIGEVVISVEKAAEQAKSLGHSLERELAFLFVHGCLHVFGFDHDDPEKEKEMFSRQRDILAAAGFTR